jgi:repressor LexA
MVEPSPRQAKVYQRLLEHRQRHGQMPDLASFARSLGITYVTLKQHLDALEHKGYLTFEGRGRGRSPVIHLPAAATGVPLVGAIPAGPLGAALTEAEGYLPLSGLSSDHFALRVRGDSMADLIQDGDVVLLERGAPASPGAICAARVGEEEATLKYIEHDGSDHLRLVPHNNAYPVLLVHRAEVQIDGIYRGLLRGVVVSELLRQEN